MNKGELVVCPNCGKQGKRHTQEKGVLIVHNGANEVSFGYDHRTGGRWEAPLDKMPPDIGLACFVPFAKHEAKG